VNRSSDQSRNFEKYIALAEQGETESETSPEIETWECEHCGKVFLSRESMQPHEGQCLSRGGESETKLVDEDRIRREYDALIISPPSNSDRKAHIPERGSTPDSPESLCGMAHGVHRQADIETYPPGSLEWCIRCRDILGGAEEPEQDAGGWRSAFHGRKREEEGVGSP